VDTLIVAKGDKKVNTPANIELACGACLSGSLITPNPRAEFRRSGAPRR
jgi:hypothetical protein